MKFGLSDSEYALIEGLLFLPLKKLGAEVWVFGSRARGDQKRFSDLDVLFELPMGMNLPSGLLARVTEALEESKLPYKVDLVQRKDIADSYRAQVEREKVKV